MLASAPLGAPAASDMTCTIVAAETYARLRPVAYWCRIIEVRGVRYVSGQPPQKLLHVMTAFQYEAEGVVFIYDIQGAIKLPTTSVDAASIQEAFQRTLYEFNVETTIISIGFLTR